MIENGMDDPERTHEAKRFDDKEGRPQIPTAIDQTRQKTKTSCNWKILSIKLVILTHCHAKYCWMLP